MVAGLTPTWHASLKEIDATEWDQLLAGSDGTSPFLRHAWLLALEEHGCAAPASGWQGHHLVLRDAQQIIRAACPMYLKHHSYGEYVFDWAWADAYNQQLATRHHQYYPKLLSAVPFSPIPGPRLLVSSDHADTGEAYAQQLLEAIETQQRELGVSSAHLLFTAQQEAEAARTRGWLIRRGVQFHWQRPAGADLHTLDDLLATFQRDKRKKIKQERRRVAEAGIRFQILEGQQITTEDWRFFYRCYAQTYLERGQQPYLTEAFWLDVGRTLPESWVLIVAKDADTPVACALLAVDRTRRVAYGRYWGALKHIDCLHFETCYYQPLDWCLRQGMLRFEGGAQGEHKLSRGLLPVNTYSAHWIGHPGFRQAASNFLDRETTGFRHYINELDERTPFRT